MRKIFLSILLLLSCFWISVCAAEYVTIGADTITAKQGEIIVVPIELKNNSGIMGARIRINYPEKILQLQDISCGELTIEGLFNTTVTDFYSVNGEFDVLWSSTEEINYDGTFAVLTFRVSDLAMDGVCRIEISYSQEDTFDEDFNDVILKCEPVSVWVGNVATSVVHTESVSNENVAEETIPEATIHKDEITFVGEKTELIVSDDYLISSVDSILASLNEPDIDNISDEFIQQNIIDFVNNRLDVFSEDSGKFETFETLVEAYYNATENEAIKDIVESTDSVVILTVFENVKKEDSVGKLEDIPEVDKQEVINKFINTLSENNSDITSFNKLKEKQKIPVLEEIIEKVQEQEENAITITDNTSTLTNNELSSGIVIAIIGVIALIAISVILIKRKRGEKS